MAVFEVNGVECATLQEAMDRCREVWREHKAPAVLEQHRAALAKPTKLDRRRAELGVEPDLS